MSPTRGRNAVAPILHWFDLDCSVSGAEPETLRTCLYSCCFGSVPIAPPLKAGCCQMKSSYCKSHRRSRLWGQLFLQCAPQYGLTVLANPATD